MFEISCNFFLTYVSYCYKKETKMKILLLGILLIAFACSKNTQGDDFLELSRDRDELINMAQSEICEDEKDWGIIAYGSKACGGPQGYMAYNLNIDTTKFFKKVEDYTKKEEKLNIKWGVVSDCAMARRPYAVECQEGEAVLLYN